MRDFKLSTFKHKTKKMKKLFAAVMVGVLALSAMAQSDNDYLEISRDILKMEKKAAIADNIQLTDEESKVFWPLYNEYQGKLYLIQNQRIELIQDFAKNFETLSDEQADALWTGSQAFSAEVMKLEKTYYKKFKKVIPAGKAARFFQVENKIETLINAQLALEIPLIETK